MSKEGKVAFSRLFEASLPPASFARYDTQRKQHRRLHTPAFQTVYVLTTLHTVYHIYIYKYINIPQAATAAKKKKMTSPSISSFPNILFFFLADCTNVNCIIFISKDFPPPTEAQNTIQSRGRKHGRRVRPVRTMKLHHFCFTFPLF